jgi:hypothetical protein
VTVKCTICQAPSIGFLCNRDTKELHRMLADLPWWIDRLIETSVGQARLGDPGRGTHRAGLERYADPKPAVDGDGTEGDRRLERDLADDRLRARLLAQGGVNAHASELLDEVQNMLGSWVRDVCERGSVDVPHIGTAVGMARWLRKRLTDLASAPCADETFNDVRSATERIERAVNRPPEPKTCGPCPTLGYHRDVEGKPAFVIDASSRSKCGTRLEARESAEEVRCPVCRQTHGVDDLVAQLVADMDKMSFTIPELLAVVLPKLNMRIPQQTLQRWHAKRLIEPSGYTTTDRGKTIPQFVLADVKRTEAQRAQRVSRQKA